MNDNEKIIRLEEEIAHLQTTNEELSGELIVQKKQLDGLLKAVQNLENRFSSHENDVELSAENQKPPHW